MAREDNSYVELMTAARDYIADNPVTYRKRIKKRANGRVVRSEAIDCMVIDLSATFPELGNRAIAELLGITRWMVREISAEFISKPAEAYDDGSEERAERAGNVEGDAAFTAAMNSYHPGRLYEDDVAAATEFEGRNRFVVIEAPNERARYRVDQSHTIPRPITLPTKPLVPLRERTFPPEGELAIAA
jgi:hypothetical protein